MFTNPSIDGVTLQNGVTLQLTQKNLRICTKISDPICQNNKIEDLNDKTLF